MAFMKIVLIIYFISWLIVLISYVCTLVRQKKARSFVDREPWYFYLSLVVLSPILALTMPFAILNDYKDMRKSKKGQTLSDEKAKIEKARQKTALSAFLSAAKNASDIRVASEQISVGRKLFNFVSKRDYDKLLSILNTMSLPQGYALGVEVAKPDAFGDNSRLFIKSASAPVIYDFFKEITVEDSCDGAWQAYLLQSLCHVLPAFGHGIYNDRTYILSKEDLMELRTMEKQDQGVVSHLFGYYIEPEVVKSDIKGKYYVTCCYWSDWSGLVRELVEIVIDNNKVDDVYKVKETVLFEYDCGVFF